MELLNTSFLTASIDDTVCGVPVSQVIEVMRPSKVHPLKDCPDFVLGVSRIRGAVTPVVDLGLLLDGKANKRMRIITVRAKEYQVAFLVDHIFGIRTFNSDQLENLPSLAKGNSKHIIHLGFVDQKLFRVIESSYVIPPNLWSIIRDSDGVN